MDWLEFSFGVFAVYTVKGNSTTWQQFVDAKCPFLTFAAWHELCTEGDHHAGSSPNITS
jgi:hypothetical protein